MLRVAIRGRMQKADCIVFPDLHTPNGQIQVCFSESPLDRAHKPQCLFHEYIELAFRVLRYGFVHDGGDRIRCRFGGVI